ncbi:hypothetical protein EDB87DRAFT_1735101 [Lactarius vividus]|nr:hypothetical protein EDB87DRAFT_1735101 [Lactarius vividus]
MVKHRLNTFWSPIDEDTLLDYLWDHRSEAGEGMSFKAPTLTGAAAKVQEMTTKGGPKMMGSCKNKWGKFKELYLIICNIKSQSGFTWSVTFYLDFYEQSLVQQAESLRIQEPETTNVLSPATNMATATYTTEQLAQMAQEEARRIREEVEAILLPINPHTGHRMTADDTAITRAIGPDQPDPPSGGSEQYCAEWVAAARSEGIDPTGVLYYKHDLDWQAPWK